MTLPVDELTLSEIASLMSQVVYSDKNVFRVIKSPELVNEVGKASVSHAINVTPIECNLEVEYIKPGESD